MSWNPDPDFDHVAAVTITRRREAMAKRQQRENEKLDADLARRGVFHSGMRVTGHYKVDSDAFDEFVEGTIDDVLGLFRDIYGEIPVEAAPWIRAKLTESFEGLSRAIVNAGQELAQRANVNWTPEQPGALFKARRRLDVELGKLEFKAKLKELTPPKRQPPPAGRDADAFVSHAREDKEAVARPIANALRARGYTVWLDETDEDRRPIARHDR